MKTVESVLDLLKRHIDVEEYLLETYPNHTYEKERALETLKHVRDQILGKRP